MTSGLPASIPKEATDNTKHQRTARPHIQAANPASITYNTSAMHLSLSPHKRHPFRAAAAPEALEGGLLCGIAVIDQEDIHATKLTS